MQEFLNQVYYGNTIYNYFIALAVFLLIVLAVIILRVIVVRRLKKWAQSTETTFDDLIIRGIERTVIPLILFSGFYFALITLTLDPRIVKGLRITSALLITFFAVRFVITAIRYGFNSYMVRKGEPDSKQKQMKGVLSIVNFFIWGLGLVFLLDNLGFDISAIIAGLGIGGIAIALAAQTILGDLFSYFVIFFDRPFEIGDYIVVNDKMGTVEYIGIKTTRIRSLGGEQVIFSNTDLVNSRVHNYKRLERRRVLFTIGVTYQTKPEQLEEIPGIIKGIIDGVNDTTFDRAHFVKYGDFSLHFEVVYFVLNSDYNFYINLHQQINLQIFKEFMSRGIEFAYPTQTLYLNKEETPNKTETTIV